MGRPIPEFEKGAMDILVDYSWPGNVRQLQNVVQRMLFLSRDYVSNDAVVSAIGMKMAVKEKQPFNFDKDHILPLKEIEQKFRKEYIQFVRGRCKTDAEASRKLDLAPPNYFRISKELGLK
jgi:DNA-binding NtrC family response regulator